MIVYITENLINNKRYIGKDQKNNPNYLGSGTLFLEDLKKYGKNNFKKNIIEYCKNRKELKEREIYWIDYYDAVKSNNFYNLVRSSGGWDHSIMSKEKYNYICSKISKGNKGQKRPNVSNDQNRKNKLKLANIGRPKPVGFGEKISKIRLAKKMKFSSEICEKIRQGKLGKKQPQSFMDKKYKPIIQLKDNIKIAEFKSIEDATNSSPKFKRSNISCCLTGISKTAYGFKWEYINP